MLGGALVSEGIGSMGHFTMVARLADFSPRTGMMGLMALFNVRGEVFAINAICPHRRGPLANGRLDGHVLACPWHDWTFDVRTDRPDHPGGHGVAAYEVEVRRSDIYVGWIKA